MRLSIYSFLVITLLSVHTSFSQNNPPVFNHDTAFTLKNTRLVIDVQANDFDPDGDPMNTVILVHPKNADLLGATNCAVSQARTLAADSIEYYPCDGYCGPDTIGYRICDSPGALCEDTAWVYIFVCAHPEANPDSITTDEEVAVTIDVQDNDTDLDSDSLITSHISGPSNGSFALIGDSSIQYTPDPNFNGRDTIFYEVCDTDGLCDTSLAIFIINPVPDTPMALPDTVILNEDASIVIQVQSNDSDADGDPLTTSIVIDAMHGSTNIINGDSISYSPDQDYNGLDTIVYQVCDGGGLCDTTIVSITVNPMPDPPVAVNDTVQLPEDSMIVIDVQINDSDADNDPLVSAVLIDALNGQTAVLDNDSIQYTPDQDYNGNDTIFYTVCDPALTCDTAMILITVTPVNDKPLAVDDSAASSSLSNVVIPVQVNDSDPDHDNLTTSVITQPANGTATVLDNDSIEFEPDLVLFTHDTLVYQVCDPGSLCDTATVYLVYNLEPNQPPVADDDSTTTFLETAKLVFVLSNDTDPDGDSLEVLILDGPFNGMAVVENSGGITYTPGMGFSGFDSLQYEICDDGLPSLCDTAGLHIEVVSGVTIPSGFSPNGDDVNDFFMILNLEHFPGAMLHVFNRWGSQVFESSDYQNDWNGTNKNGEDLPDGTYFYILQIDEETTSSGHITLHR